MKGRNPMPLRTVLAVAGALSGTTGSVVTAFSVNGVLRQLHNADQYFGDIAEANAMGRLEVIISSASEWFDARFKSATSRSTKILWLGVGLLALGFILQAVSILL